MSICFSSGIVLSTRGIFAAVITSANSILMFLESGRMPMCFMAGLPIRMSIPIGSTLSGTTYPVSHVSDMAVRSRSGTVTILDACVPLLLAPMPVILMSVP